MLYWIEAAVSHFITPKCRVSSLTAHYLHLYQGYCLYVLLSVNELSSAESSVSVLCTVLSVTLDFQWKFFYFFVCATQMNINIFIFKFSTFDYKYYLVLLKRFVLMLYKQHFCNPICRLYNSMQYFFFIQNSLIVSWRQSSFLSPTLPPELIPTWLLKRSQGSVALTKTKMA